MVYLIIGNKGSGKTKKLIDRVHEAVEKSNGNVSNYLQYIFANELTQIIRIADLNSIYDTKDEIEGFWNHLYAILDSNQTFL